MSEVKRRCQLNNCSRAASTFCYCCNKNVCTRHFTEHIDAIKLQIDPLANEINTMVEKIQGLSIEQITETSFDELQQWKIGMHQLIDEIFIIKSKEIEDLINMNKDKFIEHKKEQSETIMKIQDDIKQLVQDGDATFEQIQLFKSQLANVETTSTSFRTNFLTINARVGAEGLVTISSNLCKPPIIQIQSASEYPPLQPTPNSMAALNNLAIGTPTDAARGRSAVKAVRRRQQSHGRFNNVFQSNPAQPPLNSNGVLSFAFAPSPATPFSFGSPSLSAAALDNGSLLPGKNPVNSELQFNNNEKK